MVNCTESILEGCTYNLTKVFSSDIINAPQEWVGNYNTLMGGYPVVILLGVVAMLLYLGIKESSGFDSESAAFSGIITTICGLLLFFITLSDGTKLLTWQQLVPFTVLTFLAIIVNYVNKKH